MMDALQWTGFVLIVAGYWLFARSKMWGAVVSIVGALPLAVWAFLVDAHGVLALQVACALMNLRTVHQERSHETKVDLRGGPDDRHSGV